jgi:hypothetical protein
VLHSLKAVGVGVLIETVGFYGWYVARWFVARSLDQLPRNNITEGASTLMLYTRPATLFVWAFAQLAFVFVGGFAAGSVAKSSRVGHGVLVGLIGIAVVWQNHPPPRPLWLWLLAISALPTATGGALVAKANARRRSKVAESQYRA